MRLRAPLLAALAAAPFAAVSIGFALTAEDAAPAPLTPASDAPAPAPSTGDFAFWPGAVYDATIPTLKNVAGHENGARITRPEDVIAYFRALEAAAPDRIRVWEYGRTWEGRPLIHAAVGSKETIARLDAIRADIARLADPRTPDAEAKAAMETLPATVWIAYGVHGNEISSTDAAIMTAYHLLAAQGDATVDAILKDALVFLDPMQNPDGRARFVHNYETTAGLAPSGSRIAAERREPWPGGRTNHYLFDMNRDWFALTQPETQGRIRSLLEWRPLVFVDAHEMGSNSTYYFAPEAVPYNPHLAEAQRANLMLFGRNNAKWFDRYGFDYFTREVFDAFFPGYGASWPAYYGAVSMTYEQASARGLKARRDDGTAFDYRDTVRQHFVASVSTAEAAATNRARLLADFRDYRTSAVAEGQREGVRSYILPRTGDAAAADRLAALLVAQGVSVKTASGRFSACGRTYEAGAHVVPLAQAAKRLVRTLLDADVPIDETFLKEQERLRAKNLPDEIYDVTAWSLPLMWGVAVDACDQAAGAGALFADHDGRAFRPGVVTGPDDAVVYVVRWGERPAINFAARALAEGLVVKSTDKAFTIGAGRWPSGTLILTAAENGPGLRVRLAALAADTGAGVTGLASTWVDEGPNFGSGNVVRLRKPEIAIAWDAPASPNMAGATRFVIERQFGLPATPVRAADLTDRALDQFDVLILPGEAGFYGVTWRSLLGERGAAALKGWVERGGVLVSTGAATRWLADPSTGLLSVRREDAAREDETKKPDEDGATVPGALLKTEEDAEKAVAPYSESPDPSSGVIARARIDADHWMGAGAGPVAPAMLSGGDIYTPARLGEGVNVARFEGPERLVASGYLWAETRAQYAYKPLVVTEAHGGGHVIAFTQDPAFRAQLDGLNILLANAVLRGPAHADKP